MTIPENALSHIGLYWRADTQFANLMSGRGIEEDVWHSAFNHLLALVISIEVINSLFCISKKNILSVSEAQLGKIKLAGLGAFSDDFNTDFGHMKLALENRLHQFELWVSNVRKIQEPIFLPGSKFISALITEINREVLELNTASFFVYLDEYENLLEYQQRVINTCLKHSESPLIFNIATKRNGFVTRFTVGDESISDIADFRTHDIENYLEPDFKIFAAEVLLLTLKEAGWAVPIDTRLLLDTSKLNHRKVEIYRKTVIDFVETIFPGYSSNELANGVFSDSTMRKRLENAVSRALKLRDSDMKAEVFLRSSIPQASIVVTALLYRNHTPEEILVELDKLEKGLDNKFDGTTNWVHNNFIGCLLSLYQSASLVCPFYAGFSSFTLLAKVNLRHFLELCHQSINSYEDEAINGISPEVQARAARQTSAAFLGEIRSFGRLGNRLHPFVLRLGSLFALAHQRPSQSEPEQSHFSISGGSTPLTDEDANFLKEAVKWSVLLEVEETKSPKLSVSNVEYVLNPIYAPYFKITYRKRRILKLKSPEFAVIERGSYDEVNILMRRMAQKWKIDLSEANPNLFSHLLEVPADD